MCIQKSVSRYLVSNHDQIINNEQVGYTLMQIEKKSNLICGIDCEVNLCWYLVFYWVEIFYDEMKVTHIPNSIYFYDFRDLSNNRILSLADETFRGMPELKHLWVVVTVLIYYK